MQNLQQLEGVRNTLPSVAPWSSIDLILSTSLNEIQKLEREQSEKKAIRDMKMQIEKPNQTNTELNWNVKPQKVKSLVEIQAEESKRQQELTNERNLRDAAAVVMNHNAHNNTTKSWGNNSTVAANGIGFWEIPKKSVKISVPKAVVPPKTLVVSKTVKKSNNPTIANMAVASNSKPCKKNREYEDSAHKAFKNWCCKALATHANVIDGKTEVYFCQLAFVTYFFLLTVQTFAVFLWDIDSPFEVRDYVRMYLGM